MASWFQNQTCVPDTDKSMPCDLGNYASYSINVSDWRDAEAGVVFAREQNIRLVIKNSGHEYVGACTRTPSPDSRSS